SGTTSRRTTRTTFAAIWGSHRCTSTGCCSARESGTASCIGNGSSRADWETSRDDSPAQHTFQAVVMTHADAEAYDVTARYARGRLTADEERDFEAHLLECPKCLEDVECEIGLRDGLRVVANESATALSKTSRQTPWRAPVMSPYLAMAAAILL